MARRSYRYASRHWGQAAQELGGSDGFSLAVLDSDGSTELLVSLNAQSRVEVLDSDGSTPLAVTNVPNDRPPMGEFPVLDSDGSTVLTVPFQ